MLSDSLWLILCDGVFSPGFSAVKSLLQDQGFGTDIPHGGLLRLSAKKTFYLLQNSA